MVSDSFLDNPNVIAWKIDNFCDQFEEALNGDRWASGLYSFEHPQFGQTEFHLQAVIPKLDNDNEKPAIDVYLQITELQPNTNMQLNCQTWMEKIDGRQSDLKGKILITRHYLIVFTI
jgi:hypothetical protein